MTRSPPVSPSRVRVRLGRPRPWPRRARAAGDRAIDHCSRARRRLPTEKNAAPTDAPAQSGTQAESHRDGAWPARDSVSEPGPGPGRGHPAGRPGHAAGRALLRTVVPPVLLDGLLCCSEADNL
jgi:hypothetical protein